MHWILELLQKNVGLAPQLGMHCILRILKRVGMVDAICKCGGRIIIFLQHRHVRRL